MNCGLVRRVLQWEDKSDLIEVTMDHGLILGPETWVWQSKSVIQENSLRPDNQTDWTRDECGYFFKINKWNFISSWCHINCQVKVKHSPYGWALGMLKLEAEVLFCFLSLYKIRSQRRWISPLEGVTLREDNVQLSSSVCDGLTSGATVINSIGHD